jgi:hypothetical protein
MLRFASIFKKLREPKRLGCCSHHFMESLMGKYTDGWKYLPKVDGLMGEKK